MSHRWSAVVTGCAGFLGSHVCEALLATGHSVTGVDCFTDFYARALTERNVARLCRAPGFRPVEADIAEARLVYGPRRRPDMAFSRFLSWAIDGRPLPVLGDGRQAHLEAMHDGRLVEAMA